MSQSTSMNTFYMIVWEGTIRNAITDKMCVNSSANGSKIFKVPESLTKHNLWQDCWTLDCSLLCTWFPHVFQHRLQHHRISQVQKDVLQPGSIIGCQNVMSKEVWITFPNFSPALNPQWSKKTCPFAIAGNLDLGGEATFLSDFDPKLMDFHLHFNAPSHETNRKEIDRSSIKHQQTYNPIVDWNYSVLITVTEMLIDFILYPLLYNITMLNSTSVYRPFMAKQPSYKW